MGGWVGVWGEKQFEIVLNNVEARCESGTWSVTCSALSADQVCTLPTYGGMTLADLRAQVFERVGPAEFWD